MMKVILFVCFMGLVLGAPPVQKSKEDIESYKAYLEKAKPNNGSPLEEAMAFNPKASAWENSGKFQGDILLNDEQVENMVGNFAGSRSALVWEQTRWPGAVIVWDFAPGHYNDWERNAVHSAINEIEWNTCVRFRQRTHEHDFVQLTTHQDGCYAHVGFWPGFGAHTLNLAQGCFNHFIIIHEWMHVIGLMHMHQTYSRYNYIWINWQNIQGGMASAFDLNPPSEVTMLGTPYEYASNLHYGAYAFSGNGQPTIGAHHNDYGQMGQLTHVTGWDWTRVRRMYNCPGAWSEGIHDGELAEDMAQQLPQEDVEKPAEDILM